MRVCVCVCERFNLYFSVFVCFIYFLLVCMYFCVRDRVSVCRVYVCCALEYQFVHNIASICNHAVRFVLYDKRA